MEKNIKEYAVSSKYKEVKVEVNNIFSYLRTEDLTILSLFYKSLRFRPKGYIFSPAYQKFQRSGGKRGWDGFTAFFSNKSGRFPTGLLPEILKGLESLQIVPEVIDNRSSVDFTPITEDMFTDKGKSLRDYQVELGNKALKEGRGIIKAATGAGKTVLFTAIVRSLAERTPTMILFRSRTLVNQTYKTFMDLGVPNVGRVHMDFFEPNIITCSTIQSINHLAPLIPKVKALILDECHEYGSNLSVRTLRMFENAGLVLGFSATPFDRKDKVQKYTLKGLIGPVLGEVQTKELQERNILAESRIKVIPIVEPKIPHALFDEAYERGIVSNEKRNQTIVDLVSSHKEGKILILVEKIEHGETLNRMIKKSYWVYGETPEKEREVAAKALQNKKRKKVVVVASRVWAQGVDIPNIDVLINASGGKSERSAIQKLGRGLRKAEGKEYLDFYDFYDSTNRYLESHSKERIKTYKREGHELSPMAPPKGKNGNRSKSTEGSGGEGVRAPGVPSLPDSEVL